MSSVLSVVHGRKGVSDYSALLKADGTKCHIPSLSPIATV